ncbi:hypothetical protein PVAP13_6KG373500 [Panicum virgatum]|uniref:CCR4-NOT transcription complex subunit 4 n=1 Tax=Panicum virgatum TaxID=38727 RepID=A0A8T0RK69_PANVG|nr:hypothetical protein PVAP13_6KG373500 [Panicum virgatum]
MDRHLQHQLSTTMSDDGDHTCPLCAEEMDITDQQLKPCKCGYDICVWCWHHIIDMAEKETEGRCPACRTPYDKDRIAKMAATCERTVAEKNLEKKHKTQKVKPKVVAAAAAATSTVEAKKHLAGVRVIQRNLVYIIGLPAHLCNESVLERREYFGQYGKVLKVSVSRPTGPPSQQASANNNISVYITYAKEAEAIRCIQAVHNFVLEGKVLRACFGTTKYCHAWLRNLTCGNPDCLYLHEVGGQEDSFTKDEVISAYTRVPQMASSVSQRRAGTVLPPPVDDFSYSAVVSAKHTIKNGTLNTNNQPRLSPPNSSSGRSTLPPASSWGHRDFNARTTANGVTSTQSQTKSKSEPQINSFSSSSTIASTVIPSSWNDDTSTAPEMPEGWQVSEQDSASKTIEPYKPGIVKETHSLSSLDIDFSTIPSAWNDDDIVVSDGMSKGSEEIQAAKENGKLTHLASKSPISPKKDLTMNITSKHPSDFVSDLAISKSDVKTGDGDRSVTKITPKSPTSADVNCQSCVAASEKILEDIGLRETDIEKLSVQISLVKLNGNDEVHSMAVNHQPDAMPCTSVTLPIGQNFDRGQPHMKHDELLHSENMDTVLSSQYGSDNHLDWTSKQQSCSVTSLNDIVNSTAITDKLHSRLMDGSGQPSYSSFAGFPNTLGTSLWNDTESNPTSMIGTTTSQMQSGFSSIDKARALLNGDQDGRGTVHTPGNVSGHPVMGSHQPGAMGSVRSDNVGSFDKTISVNKDESRIISDMLSSEFNLWDDSFLPANNFLRMLRESENNDVPFTVPSWKSGSGSRESRFSFARQDSQGNLDSSLRNCASDQNFSLLPQISQGNFYQNGSAFQSLENDPSNNNSLAMSDMATTGSSRSKISAPPGFSAPARVPPPGFSSGFPSQDGLNPPPGFSSGISSQEMSKTPPRLPSPFSSGLSSQDGPNPPSRSFSAFSSGLSLQDGPNHPSRFPSAFTSGFSSRDGSNQVYGSMYPETLLWDNALGRNSSHYQVPFGRHTNDIEFNDPAILAVGKGRMPGIGDSGLEMKNTHVFPAHLQTSNNDPRFQLQMQPNVQSHQNLRFTDHMHDAFNPMNDNYLASRFLQQSHGPVSPYAQMPQQPRNSQLTNGHLDGWSNLRQGNNNLMSDMSRMLYPSEVNNLHMLGSNDIYTRAFGM